MHELGNTNALKNKSAVPRPKTVVTYNKFMGGFYLSDSFQYLFRLLEKKKTAFELSSFVQRSYK